MNIIKVSPKGQLTIPKKVREFCNSDQYLFELQGKTIVLKPLIIKTATDNLEEFSGLAKKSFSFWENEEDDVYQKFYKSK